MNCSVREIVEEFLRLLRFDVIENAALTTMEDSFEIKQTPCLVVMGPEPVLNRSKITVEPRIERDVEHYAYEKRNPLSYCHLDFELTLVSNSGPELIDLTAALMVFFLDHKKLLVGADDSFHLKETTPLGGLQRVNLSNLRQASGKCRIEDVELADQFVEHGKLVRYRELVIKDKPSGAVLETVPLDQGA